MSPLYTPGKVVLRRDTVAATDTNIREVSLLLHGNGTNGSTTIVDSSLNPKAVTAVGDAQISTAQSKFGGSSIAFDGSGDAVITPSVTALQMAGENFTWECWVYLNALPSAGNFATLWAQRSGTGTNAGFGGPAVVFNSAGLLNLFISNAAGNGWEISNFNTTLSASITAWQHIALVRNGTSLTLFRDGIAGSSPTISFNVAATDATSIGAGGANAIQSINGYIDELRITKGVARYTANFTPPTLPFPDF